MYDGENALYEEEARRRHLRQMAPRPGARPRRAHSVAAVSDTVVSGRRHRRGLSPAAIIYGLHSPTAEVIRRVQLSPLVEKGRGDSGVGFEPVANGLRGTDLSVTPADHHPWDFRARRLQWSLCAHFCQPMA